MHDVRNHSIPEPNPSNFTIHSYFDGVTRPPTKISIIFSTKPEGFVARPYTNTSTNVLRPSIYLPKCDGFTLLLPYGLMMILSACYTSSCLGNSPLYLSMASHLCHIVQTEFSASLNLIRESPTFFLLNNLHHQVLAVSLLVVNHNSGSSSLLLKFPP